MGANEVREAIANGFTTVSELNSFSFEKDFKKFKEYLSNNYDEWEAIERDDVQRLFIYEMFQQGGMPKGLDVSDYINDTGIVYMDSSFLENERKLIETIENLNEEEFSFQRNLGVDVVIEILKDLK